MTDAREISGYRGRIVQQSDAVPPTIVGYRHLVVPTLKTTGNGDYETRFCASDFVRQPKNKALGWLYTMDTADRIFENENSATVEEIDGRLFKMISAIPSTSETIDYTKTGYGGTQGLRIWGRNPEGTWGAFDAHITLHDQSSSDDDRPAELTYDDFGYRLLLLQQITVSAEFDEKGEFKPIAMNAKLWLLRDVPQNISVKWRFMYDVQGDNPYLDVQTFAYERAGSSWCQLEFCDVRTGKKAWANVTLMMRNPLSTSRELDPFVKPSLEQAQNRYAKDSPLTALNDSVCFGTGRRKPDELDPCWMLLPLDPNPPDVAMAITDLSTSDNVRTKLMECTAVTRAGSDGERNFPMFIACTAWD